MKGKQIIGSITRHVPSPTSSFPFTVFNSNLFLYKSITLNSSASANLKLQVAEKWLNMEWIWGQQDSLEWALACSSHNHPATSILGGIKKLLLLHIFGYKNLFVMAGIQSWSSCCLPTWGWPTNCHVTTSLPPSASPLTRHYNVFHLPQTFHGMLHNQLLCQLSIHVIKLLSTTVYIFENMFHNVNKKVCLAPSDLILYIYHHLYSRIQPDFCIVTLFLPFCIYPLMLEIVSLWSIING